MLNHLKMVRVWPNYKATYIQQSAYTARLGKESNRPIVTLKELGFTNQVVVHIKNL